MEIEVPILKATVWVENQEKPLGRVYDFTFDTISPRILSLKVSTSRLGSWGPKAIIPAQRITTIDAKGIHITNNLLKVKNKNGKIKETLKDLEPKLPEMDAREK